jgi:death-on-curing protein
MIDAAMVIEIHDLILSTEAGLVGGYGSGPVEGALARVQNRVEYAGLEDIFDIAAMYAVAIARGHVFNDANKRTALVTALTFLALQGVELAREPFLEEIMVLVAEGAIEDEELSLVLYSIAKNEGLVD